MSRKLFLLAATCCLSVSAVSQAAITSLSPGAPVKITSSGDIDSAVVVSGTSNGYMATCNSSNTSLTSIFSSNGTTWNAPNVVNLNSYTGMWVSGTNAGFMVTFIEPIPGYITAAPFSIFNSAPATSAWDAENLIVSSSNIATPVLVWGTTAGFMATFHDTTDDNPYSALSSDSGNTWSTPQIIDNAGTLNSAVGVVGDGNNFMATWKDSVGAAYSSYSTNNGTSWSARSLITNAEPVVSDVFVGENLDGFMAVWLNDVCQVMTSFSSDNGSSWSSPVEIVSFGADQTDVYVCGTASGFIVAWIGQDNNAYASLSSDNGASWSTPVAITSNGDIALPLYLDSSRPFISVTAVGDNYMFGWREGDDNAYVSFSGSAIESPSQISGYRKKNNFGSQYELFNHIAWSASSSTGLTGYYVYRNGVKIATLSSSTLVYDDHNQRKGSSTLYSVTAFDANGSESTALSITIN